MIAVSAVQPHLGAAPWLRWSSVVICAVSGYAFCVALPLAAITGVRGLSWSGNGFNKVVYLGNVVGSVSSLLANVLLVIAVGLSLCA
jgi:hypothetical protein